MGRASSSLLFRILAPIAMVLTLVTVGLVGLVQRISSDLAGDYQSFAAESYAIRVRSVLETAVAELRTADLLGNPVVEQVKQRQVIESLTLLWREKRLDGLVVGAGGEVLFSSLPPGATARLAARGGEGHFEVEDGSDVRHGTITRFLPWRWKIVTLLAPAADGLLRREVVFLLPLLVGGLTIVGATVYMVLRRSFQRPVARLLADVSAGRPVRETGVTEIDTVGRAVNAAVERLLRKTEQYHLLHNLAVSLHEVLSVEDLLKVILGRAKEIVGAELAAVVVYDERGGIAKLHALPDDVAGSVASFPIGRGILGAVRDAAAPLHIENLREHPVFSGSFPPGHPEVRNVLGFPIFSPEGRPSGALYFGNKPGGFTPEDENLLLAITADAAIAISRAESLAELRRFRQVVESSFNVILLADADGTVRYANQAFEAATGHPREAVVGRPLGFLGVEVLDEADLRRVRDAVLAGEPWRGEVLGRRGDGTPYSTAAVVFAVRTDGDTSLVSIQRELTQERKLAEQLLRAQKLEAIGTLACGIAHDFNNILAGILGYAELIQLQTREGEPFHRAAVVIGQAAERGGELARKILLVARKEPPELQSVNLNALVRETTGLLRVSLPANIALELRLGEGLPPLCADPAQVHQVVLNLTANARDAMPDGGQLGVETAPALPAELAEAGGPPDAQGYVRLTVSDTGTGMDEQTIHRVYDPFFSTKEPGRGTGLGLFIVQAVVANHQGFIAVASEPGCGTSISIYLPAGEPVTAKPEETPEGAGTLGGSGTVLVIDDEADLRNVYADVLGSFGYTVLTADGGREGLDIFQTRRGEIDLVILDLTMPKLGGAEVFQVLKGLDPDVRVILCSGYSREGHQGVEALLAAGAAGFLPKPFTVQALGTAVREALARRK